MLDFLRFRPKRYFNIKRSTQITDSHCGPAVIQMLLSNVGIEVSQEAVTRAAGALTTVEKQGTRVDQLAQAVRRIAPQMQFWYKDTASIDDLRVVLRKFEFPVGVEWQGIFGQRESGRLDTDGHYSLVTHIDETRRYVTMVDPYEDFVLKDRQVSIPRFVRLWWDTNTYSNRVTKQTKVVKDSRLFFVITPKEIVFPEKMKMKKGEEFRMF